MSKYFVHSLAFLCIPIIIIRGIQFFSQKEVDIQKIKFTPVLEPRTKIIWWGKNRELQFVFTPYTNSKKLNVFNDEVMRTLLQDTSYVFGFLTICNFSSKSIDIDPAKINLFLESGEDSYRNLSLNSNIKNNKSFYIKWILKKTEIKPMTLKKCLVAFDKRVDIFLISSAQVVFQKREILLRKIVCLKEQFDEFIQKPTSQFFTNE